MNKKRISYKTLYYECKTEKDYLEHQVDATKLILKSFSASLDMPIDENGYKSIISPRIVTDCWHENDKDKYICDLIRNFIRDYKK